MGKRLLLIINPHAGRAAIKAHALDVIDVFVREGYDVTCYTTQKTGDPAEIVEKIGCGFDRIVCCGGDGTVNEGLNGLMRLQKRPELGIIPAGVTNDYAYNLAIPSNAIKAAKVAAAGYPFAIDVGELEGQFFSYVAAFGLFTDVTYETNQNFKNALGRLAYLLEGVKRVSAIKSYRMCIEHDGGIEDGNFIIGLFSNSISVAGVRTMYEDALLDDGKIEIALVKMPTTLEDVQDIIEVLLNIESASSKDSDFFTIIHTEKAKITGTKPVAWTVDGESGGIHTTVEVRAHRCAVTVVAGRDMASNSVTALSGEETDAETHKLV